MLRTILLLALAAPAVAVAQQPAEYRLGPEDVVQIQVPGRTDLSVQVAVDLDGRLHIPAVGDVAAANRTPAEVGSELGQRFRLVDPGISQVLVSVVDYKSRSISVVGEVRNPGRFGFRDIPSLWDVLLQSAGGPTSSADMSGVEIIRKEAGEGEPKIVRVDLSRGIEHTDAAALPALRPKDTINVPSQTAETVPTGDSFQVLGAVRTPGMYRLSAASTVVTALAASGGPLPEADLGRVQLTRSTAQGVVAYRLDLQGHLFEGRPAGDLPLQSGDTLTVPSSGFNFVKGITTVLPFITVLTSLLVTYETLKD